jgi:hypothetical protein
MKDSNFHFSFQLEQKQFPWAERFDVFIGPVHSDIPQLLRNPAS